MKLAKVTRQRLHAAQGKPIEISWPKGAPEALSGHKYPVYGPKGKLFQIRVEAVKGRKAVIVVDGDPHRPMLGINGIRREDGSYESEPERVDVATEKRYAMEGEAKTVRLGAEARVAEDLQRLQAEAREAQTAGREGRTRKLKAQIRQVQRKTELFHPTEAP